MLFTNKLTQTLNFGTTSSQLSLHPFKLIMATNQSSHLLITDFQKVDQTETLDLHKPIQKIVFANHHHLIAISPGFELTLIDWETKETIGRTHITVSDPKLLSPVNILIKIDYNPLPSAFQEIKQIWVLQNYTLLKAVGANFADKQSAGYSLHCLDKDLKEVFASYVPSHENAIMFERNQDTPTQFTVAEPSKIKTLEIKDGHEIKIVKMMKSNDTLVQIEEVQKYGLMVIINLSGNLQVIHIQGGLIYEHHKNEQNGAFTCFCIQGSLLYTGTEKGVIVVFDLQRGTFIKQVPYQGKIFGQFNLKKNVPAPSVSSIQVNHSETLLAYYKDNSFVVLDQLSKTVLAFQKGLGSPITQLEWLPLLNSECFFMKTSNQVISYIKNQLTQKWEFMILDLESAGCMNIDPSLNSLSIATEKVLTSYDLRKFNKIKEFKVSGKISGIKEREDGYMAIVSENKVCLCREYGAQDEYQILIDIDIQSYQVFDQFKIQQIIKLIKIFFQSTRYYQIFLSSSYNMMEKSRALQNSPRKISYHALRKQSQSTAPLLKILRPSLSSCFLVATLQNSQMSPSPNPGHQALQNNSSEWMGTSALTNSTPRMNTQ